MIVGESYLYGRGNEQDLAEAFKWFQKAAEGGDPGGQMHTAIFYRGGLGVEANPKLVVYWYRQAAERWYFQAQYHLAMCYGTGFGVNKDVVEAYKWATLAMDHGYRNADRLCKYLKTEIGITAGQVEEARQRANEFSKTNNFRPPAEQWPDIPLPEDASDDSARDAHNSTNALIQRLGGK